MGSLLAPRPPGVFRAFLLALCILTAAPPATALAGTTLPSIGPLDPLEVSIHTPGIEGLLEPRETTLRPLAPAQEPISELPESLVGTETLPTRADPASASGEPAAGQAPEGDAPSLGDATASALASGAWWLLVAGAAVMALLIGRVMGRGRRIDEKTPPAPATPVAKGPAGVGPAR